jgi:hypothetical protein
MAETPAEVGAARAPRFTLWPALAVCLYWFWLAYPAFLTHLNADDFKNLYFAWQTSWSELFGQMAQFWQMEGRPVGQAFYKAVFAFAGLEPRAFHDVRIALIAANLILLYGVLRKFSSSVAVCGFSLLLLSFHPALWDLYASSGTVYDLLCCTFCLCGLFVYLTPRRAGETLGVTRTVAVTVFTILAIDSKELGVILGAVLVLYELVFHGAAELRRWRVLLPVAPVLAAGAAGVLGRILAPGPVGQMPSYAPALTAHGLNETFVVYTGFLFDRLFGFHTGGALLFWAVMLALALVARSKTALFGLGAFWCFLAPMLVAPPRVSGYILYLPFVGLTLYACGLADAVRARLAWRRKRVLRLGLILTIALHGLGLSRVMADGRSPAGQEDALDLLAQAPRLRPVLPAEGKVLLVNPPFGLARYQGLYILGLEYRLPKLNVRHVIWDPADGDFLVRKGAYAAVLLYDPRRRAYCDITAACEVEVPGQASISHLDMVAPDTDLAIIGDVSPPSADGWRLCRAHPHFRLTASREGAQRIRMLVRVPSDFLRAKGPLRMTINVNGRPAAESTLATSDETIVEAPLPQPLKQGEIVDVVVDVLNPWETANGGGYVSFLVWRIQLK